MKRCPLSGSVFQVSHRRRFGVNERFTLIAGLVDIDRIDR